MSLVGMADSHDARIARGEVRSVAVSIVTRAIDASEPSERP